MKVVFGIVLSLIVLTALFITYMHFRTYTIGKNLKFSEITHVYCMSSVYSSEYGYCYDQYSVSNRSNRYYAKTDLFDQDKGEQIQTTVPITEEEAQELISGNQTVFYYVNTLRTDENGVLLDNAGRTGLPSAIRNAIFLRADDNDVELKTYFLFSIKCRVTSKSISCCCNTLFITLSIST